MEQVTAGWVLQQVEELAPGQYSDEMKRHWLAQAEGFVAQALGQGAPQTPEDGTVLLAPVPYEGLYSRYVEGQIHYHNGEMGRYNNAMAAWNELFLAWQNRLYRQGGQSGVQALKLC